MTAIIYRALLVLQFIPALINIIRAIEDAIPGEGKGEMRLAAVRELIEAVYDQGSELWPSFKKAIDILVATFNKTGVFVKTN